MPEPDRKAEAIPHFDWQADLALITEAAREAGKVAMAHFGQSPEVWWKNEGRSPVSAADFASNDRLQTLLLGSRPGYGWLSEETDDDAQRLSRDTLFVVDPIDGTVAYMKNKPWWCVPIAVVEDGEVVAAVIHAPEVDETYVATRGGGARRNGKPIHASDVDTLEDASILGDARLIEAPYFDDEPWPAMLRTLWGDDQRFKDTYWSRWEGLYFAGDGARNGEAIRSPMSPDAFLVGPVQVRLGADPAAATYAADLAARGQRIATHTCTRSCLSSHFRKIKLW